jgi:uncharacterized protein (TIGR00251 family)
MLEKFKEQLQATGEVVIKVKVHAKAHETRIKSVLADGVIKIDIQATPENGKGNDALFSFLANEFSVPVSTIQILLGKFSADKTVKIKKISE